MLYPKNKSEKLDIKLFENPTSEYRGTPFWAWNTNLRRDELLWQIDRLKEMGFGGYHMHVRSGMNTEYLSEDFMNLISACVEHGKEKGMLSWLYDEDRWPSGAAGGIVTKEPRFRQRYIAVRHSPIEDATDPVSAYKEGKPYLLAAYDIILNDNGELDSYKRISADAPASGKKIYAYSVVPSARGWFNGQTYVDTLSCEAMDRFIDVTYEPYLSKVGEDFGKSVPAIFTDEPQFKKIILPAFAKGEDEAQIPWTYSFDESFKRECGYSIADRLPEVIWDLKGGAPSKVRYDYYNHTSELFARAFADNCGKWCDEHGIALTGHLMEEPTIRSQMSATGEAMRSYRGFGIPGIDMLCDAVELTTAKQAQSATHQYGKEGMLSELYGVTGWAFDFRGHKFQGDWQAALGVTVRVPHLSWVSMKGSAKRDYPASIHYQSAWYNKYPYVEDHFARLNTALTRGEPDVKIAVIHPIESGWLSYGPRDTSCDKMETLEYAFANITNYLISSQLDFNYIAESLLPELYGGSADAKLKVGKMAYSAVVVPPVRTLRKTTVNALVEFIKAGGKVIFTSECPECVDGEISDYARALYDMADKCDFTKLSIVNALKDYRDVTLKDSSGSTPSNLLYAMRRDGDCKWLFITRFVKPGLSRFYDPQLDNAINLSIRVKGTFLPSVYDTVSGKVLSVPYKAKDGYTELSYNLFASDSLLLRLDDATDGEYLPEAKPAVKPSRYLEFKESVPYRRGEPNVMVLDLCRYSWDGESYSGIDEMLRIDARIRREFSWPAASGGDCQPWAIEEEKIDKFVYLKFEFESEVSVPCKLAFEEAEEIIFNGEQVPVLRNGWFCDREIYTTDMPNTVIGKNTLVVKTPISKRVSIENMFLLGDFGVKVCGTVARLVPEEERIAFGSITEQGMPFYGAALTYDIPIKVKSCDLTVCASLFAGAVIGVSLDGKEIGNIAYAPFKLSIPDVDEGEHTLSLTLYATRVNTFGALHNCTDTRWKGPGMYYTRGCEWSYEYALEKVGILKSPIVEVYEK